MREGRRGDEGRIGDVHPVVDLVAFLQPAQHRHRVLDPGLFDDHGLEAAFEGRVLLHVLAVLVQGGRPDAVQLAARERGLEHVAGIHGALRPARSDHGVELVDEEHDPPLLLREVVQERLHAFLELAAELRARDHRTHVERQDAAALETFGHFAVHDALGEPLDDRGLADPRLADEDRVVLGPALEHLDGASNLVVPPDDWIELALLGPLGEVDGELLEGLAMLLRVGVLYRLPAPDRFYRLRERVLPRSALREEPSDRAGVAHRREHHQLARDVAVRALLGELVRHVDEAREVAADMHVAGGAGDWRDTLDEGPEPGPDLIDVHLRLAEQRAHAAVALIEQRDEQMGGLDELVVTAHREAPGIGKGELEPRRQLFR